MRRQKAGQNGGADPSSTTKNKEIFAKLDTLRRTEYAKPVACAEANPCEEYILTIIVVVGESVWKAR